MTGDGPQEAPEVGSVGEEAAKLLAALSGWARDHGGQYADAASGSAASFADAAREVNEHIATGSEDCRYCPVCRGIHVVRGLSPEVREHLVSAAGSTLQAIAVLMRQPSDRSTDNGSGTKGERIRLDGD